MTNEADGAVVEETQADEGAEQVEGETGLPAGGDAQTIQQLRDEIQYLKGKMDAAQGSQQDSKPEFTPKPLFTDEEFEAIDPDQRPVYKALNQMHIDRQADRHAFEQRIAELESTTEATGQKESIKSYVASVPEFAKDPALANAFETEVARALREQDGNSLLDAIRYKVLATSKGKPDRAGATSKPRSAAGPIRKDIISSKYMNADLGMEAAKKKILGQGT